MADGSTRQHVVLLTAAVGLVGANSLVLSPLIATVAADFALSEPTDVLRAAASFGLGTALSALVLAPQADRIGAARALGLSLLGLIAGFLLSAIAPTLWVLIIAQGVAGLASGLALPSAYSLATQIAQPGAENRTLGTVLTGWTLAMVFGVTLSALLADITHWRVVFAAIALLTTLLYAATLARPLPNLRADVRSSPISALRVPGVWRGLFVQACFMTAFYGTYSFLGAHLNQVLGIGTAAAALPVLAYGLGFGASVIFDPLLDRHGYRKMAPVFFGAISSVLFVIAGVSGGFAALIGAFFAYGLVNHAGLTLITGRLSGLSRAQRGAILGLNSTVTYLCVALATVSYTPLYAMGGFALCAATSAVIALFMVLENLLPHPNLAAKPEA